MNVSCIHFIFLKLNILIFLFIFIILHHFIALLHACFPKDKNTLPELLLIHGLMI